jgi:TPR repeat protein
LAADSSTFHHALLLLRTGDLDGARQWLQIAANGGHVRAMTLLGLYHAESGNETLATQWLTRAAEAGDESAMNFLGAVYDGQGNVAAAVQWWGRAAQLGNAQAMYNLGELLITAGYTQDGEGWVRAAAEAGHARAMSRLGDIIARATIPEQRSSYGDRSSYDRAPYGTAAQETPYNSYESAAYDPEPTSRPFETTYAPNAWGTTADSGLAATTNMGYAASTRLPGGTYMEQQYGRRY